MEEGAVDGEANRSPITVEHNEARGVADLKKMQEEFNVQRAKMRELFMHKEAECKKYMAEIDSVKKELDEVKSQLVVAQYKTENEMRHQERRAQEEIASLQQLVQDTIEESSICKVELQKFHDEGEKLKQENRDLRELLTHQQQDTPSLAPVLSHVKKTLARKLGADSSGNDSLDDSMRKVNKYAQEDAEVLRSLVVPLEEEIKALKEKLRTADEELQGYRVKPKTSIKASSSSTEQQVSNNSITTIQEKQPTKPNQSVTATVSKSTSMDSVDCKMCRSYDQQLVQVQKSLSAEREKNEQIQKSYVDAREELDKEAALRRDLEEQWQEKRDAHKEQVQTLTEQVKRNEKELINVQHTFIVTKDELSKHLQRLVGDRQNINKHLETLQNDNDFLAGKYLLTSEELQNKPINLPNNVEELHLLLLKQRDELILARVGYEYESRKCQSFVDETQVLRDQLESVMNERQAYEKSVQNRIRSLEERLKDFLVQQHDTETRRQEFQRNKADLDKQISDFRVQSIELRDTNEKLDKANMELRNRLKTMQDELSTSEHVQKDFVKLSQSLQIELERIRQADTQVRWQDDDDVENCKNCNALFTVTCRKQHCRHCGIIYCEKCLTKTVPSGPRNKPARVCDICHTLLIPNTAPYFSQAPPQSPT